jgi:hypothetical protein
MVKFNVFYEVYGGILRTYCVQSMDINEAEEMLAKFRSRYLDSDGNGKAFPNGKGFYNYRNPHIRRV